MRTSGVIGKQIVRIDQRKFYNDFFHKMDNEVLRIVLNDGTELVPTSVVKEDEDYGTEFIVVKPKKARKT